MPIPDWSRVPTGNFHDSHQDLIIQIKRDLNAGILPTGYYAMAEQVAGGLGPDVLGPHRPPAAESDAEYGGVESSRGGPRGTLVAAPKVRIVAEADAEYYRRKQTLVSSIVESGPRTGKANENAFYT